MRNAGACCAVTGLGCRYMKTCTSWEQLDLPLTVSPSMRLPEASHASRSATQLEDATTQSTSGRKTYASPKNCDLVGSLLKTSLASAIAASTGYAVTWSSAITPSGRSVSILRRHAVIEGVIDSSSWPTPTATANHDAPSMRKWPAYRQYQDAVGRTTPRLWEWMMGFPAGWTRLGS